MEPFEHLDSYSLLGVSPAADLVTLKQAYLRQIARYHPDRWANAHPAERTYAARRSQRITAAYQNLSQAPQLPMPVRPRRVETSACSAVSRAHEHYERAEQLLQQGDSAEALVMLRALEKRDPQYPGLGSAIAMAEDGVQRGSGCRALVAAGVMVLLALVGRGWLLERQWVVPREVSGIQGPRHCASIAPEG